MRIKEWIIKKLGGLVPTDIENKERFRLIDARISGTPETKEEMDALYTKAAEALGIRLYEKDCINWIVEENLAAKEISLRALVKVKE